MSIGPTRSSCCCAASPSCPTSCARWSAVAWTAPSRRRRRRLRLALAGLAALVLVALAAWLVRPRRGGADGPAPAQEVARVLHAEGVTWGEGVKAREVGDAILAGRLRLRAGH